VTKCLFPSWSLRLGNLSWQQHSRPEYLNTAERNELLTRPCHDEWSAKLPPTDFKERTEELSVRTNLKLASLLGLKSRSAFEAQDNQVGFTDHLGERFGPRYPAA